MTRLLTTCTAVALLFAGAAYAQPSVSGGATAPANPAMAGTAGARATMPAPMPAPTAAPMPAATPVAGKPMMHRGMRHHRMHPMAHRRGMPMARGAARGRGVPTEQGSAAVDSLNDQSLARARNGQ